MRRENQAKEGEAWKRRRNGRNEEKKSIRMKEKIELDERGRGIENKKLGKRREKEKSKESGEKEEQ